MQNAEALPDPFFDADSIAQGLGSYDDPRDQRQARQIVDDGIAECLKTRQPFGFETTYSGNSRPNLIRTAHRLGYSVRCAFVGTESSEINVVRVAYRVASETGHSIAVYEIHRRWQACQDNLVETADCFDRIQMLDNSGRSLINAGEIRHGRHTKRSPHAPQWAQDLIQRIASYYTASE